ncbi:MAG: hypothetical protein CM1200mP2_50460 [Planctomycetaceae bacterium]|nr:MAG: hypothetical protein CM1200mP2_50460 [Planctomycetaceae bacterium]
MPARSVAEIGAMLTAWRTSPSIRNPARISAASMATDSWAPFGGCSQVRGGQNTGVGQQWMISGGFVLEHVDPLPRRRGRGPKELRTGPFRRRCLRGHS